MAESSTASAAPKTQLLRILGLDFGLAVVLGATVGVGILRLPGTVAAQLGSFWPIVAVWIVGGIYTLLGSLSLAELSAMLPQAGGFYVYGKRAFGELVGFAVGWGDWLNNCATLAYASFAAAEFLVLLAPALPAKPRTIALALLIGFTAMHWFGLRDRERRAEINQLGDCGHATGVGHGLFSVPRERGAGHRRAYDLRDGFRPVAAPPDSGGLRFYPCAAFGDRHL